MNKSYIHYGAKEYNPDLFLKVKNMPLRNKPAGGLWASPVDSAYGWENWNKSSNFVTCDKDNSFLFTLSEKAKIFHIYGADDLDNMPKQKLPAGYIEFTPMIFPDFEAMITDGYDGIELHLSEERISDSADIMDGLNNELYGWDCDSIVIFNKDVIIPLDKTKEAEDSLIAQEYETEDLR